MKFFILYSLCFFLSISVYSQLTELESNYPLYRITVPGKEPQMLPKTLAINDQMYSFALVSGALDYYKGPNWEMVPKNQFTIISFQSNLDKRIFSKPFGLFRGAVVNSTLDSSGNLYLTTTAKLHSTVPKKKTFEKPLDTDSIYVTCILPSTSVQWSRSFGFTNASDIQFHTIHFTKNLAKIYFQSKDTLYQFDVNSQGNIETQKQYAIPKKHRVSFLATNPAEELIVLTTKTWGQYEISYEEQHLLITYNVFQTIKWQEFISGTRFEVFIKSLLVDTKGTIYVVGNFLKEITSDFTTVKSKGQQDIFIIKVSSQGKTILVNGIGGADGDNISAVTLSSSNDLILSGQMYSKGTILNEKLEFFNQPFTFVAKISSDNRIVFSKVFSGYSVLHSKITEDHYKRILLIGSFKDTLLIRDGKQLVSKGGNDFFLATYDEFGNLEAYEPFGTADDESLILDCVFIPNNRFTIITYNSKLIPEKKTKEYSQVLWRYRYQR